MKSSEYAWRSPNGSITSFSEAVFPICRRNNDGTWEGLATGFFVSKYGIFLTAAHVFSENVDGEELFITHFFEEEHTHCQRRVLRAYCHNLTDVAIGVAEPIQNHDAHTYLFGAVLALSEDIPANDDEVFSFGYPLTTVINHGEVTPVLLEPFWTRGLVEQAYPTGRDRVMQPGHCIQTNLESYGGSSGAPVMDSHGRTFGVISTGGLSDRTSFVAPISDALDIKMPGVVFKGQPDHIPTLRELVPYGGRSPIPT